MIKNYSSFTQQWHIIKQDKWLFSCLTWLPIALALLMASIFSQGIARDLPIAIVDLSHSKFSRELGRALDASPALQVSKNYQSIAMAKTAMVNRDIYGYVVIPAQFDRDIYKGLQPQVSVFYNSQFVLIGKLVNSAVIPIISTLNAKLSVGKSLSQGNVNTAMALGSAVNIQTQITPLFNKNTNYTQFLLSAIVPALWQIFIVAGTILILSANARLESKQALLKSNQGIVLRLMCYFPLFLLQGLLFLLWFYQGFSWPMHGSLVVIILAQSLTVIACMIMGAFFYFLTLDPARSMSLAGAFTAPSFAFMGITFPVSDMNLAAQWWRNLLPISHYIEVQVAQVNYGASWLTSLIQLLPMLGYIFFVLLIALLIPWQRLKNTKVEEVTL